jgi:hypothetical protein
MAKGVKIAVLESKPKKQLRYSEVWVRTNCDSLEGRQRYKR